VFDSVKKFFTSKPTEDHPDYSHVPELMGLRLGGSIELNDLKLRLIDGATTFQNVGKIHLIQAVGVVKLDETTRLLRYYTDTDGFLQFALEAGMTESHITDGKLFFFYETRGIGSDLEWNRQIENEISRPTYMLDEKSFARTWQVTGERNPPIAMTETTYRENEKTTSADQFVMLYERQAQEGLLEYLMVSGEEQIIGNNADRCLVTSTGIDINQADFAVIS